MRSTLRSPSPDRASGSPRKSVRIRPAADFKTLLDADGDGEVGYDEWVASFNFVDKDSNGLISKEEFTSIGGHAPLFDAIDTRRKHVISLSDWCKAYDRMDKDKKLKLSSKTFTDFVAAAQQPHYYDAGPSIAPAYPFEFEGTHDCAWNKNQKDLLTQHGVCVDPTECPRELLPVLRKLRHMLSIRLADDSFVSYLLGGREYSREKSASLAQYMGIPRTQGPPNIRFSKEQASGECTIYSGKRKPLYAQQKAGNFKPVMFQGAYERCTSTLFVNPQLLSEEFPEIESVLIQLMASYVTQALVGSIQGDEGLRALDRMSNVRPSAGMVDVFKHYSDHGFLRLQGPGQKYPAFIAADFAFCEDAVLGNRIVSTSWITPPKVVERPKPPPPQPTGPGRFIQRTRTRASTAALSPGRTRTLSSGRTQDVGGASPPGHGGGSPQKQGWVR